MKIPKNHTKWTQSTKLDIIGKREGCGSLFSREITLGELIQEAEAIAERGDFELPDTLQKQIESWADGRYRNLEITTA
jgi:hypothetical protein